MDPYGTFPNEKTNNETPLILIEEKTEESCAESRNEKRKNEQSFKSIFRPGLLVILGVAGFVAYSFNQWRIDHYHPNPGNGDHLIQDRWIATEEGTGDACSLSPYSILGRPTEESLSINFLSDYSAVCQVTYQMSESSAVDLAQQDVELLGSDIFQLTTKQPYTLDLTGLKPSSKYEYYIRFRNTPDCEEQYLHLGHFRTQRFFNEEFQFAIIADTHWKDTGAYEPAVFQETLKELKEASEEGSGLDFMVDLGDTFMGLKLEATQEQAPQLYEDIFKLYSPVASSAPLFLINGNHDGEIGYFIPMERSLEEQENSSPVNYARLRNKYFLNPKPNTFYAGNQKIEYTSIGLTGNYYAWNWGNAFFVTLDPYWFTRKHVKTSAWQWTLGLEQYNWLHDVLEGSAATFKFVFIHQYVGGVFGTERGYGGTGDETYAQYFEWGGLGESGEREFEENRPGWNYGPIHQILVDHGVSVVFRGHDHLFHTGVLDGVIYNTLPKTSTSDSIFHEDMVNEKGYEADEVTLRSGHTEVKVSENQAQVMFKEYTTNSIMHQYTVLAAPGPDTTHQIISANNDPTVKINTQVSYENEHSTVSKETSSLEYYSTQIYSLIVSPRNRKFTILGFITGVTLLLVFVLKRQNQE